MNNLTPENINVATWKIPSPLGIIGSHANGEFNGMTASWITQVSMDPPLIGVGIDNKSVTFNLMNQSDFFTINMFSPEYTKVFVKFSKPAIILRIVVFPAPKKPVIIVTGIRELGIFIKRYYQLTTQAIIC